MSCVSTHTFSVFFGTVHMEGRILRWLTPDPCSPVLIREYMTILTERRLVTVIKVPKRLMLSWKEGALAQSQILLFVQRQPGQVGSLDAQSGWI